MKKQKISKQELIKKLKQQYHDTYTDDWNDAIETAIELAEQLEEPKEKQIDFDYGIIEIEHRLGINKPINHEKILIEKGIRMGLVKKCRNFGSFETGIKYENYWEVQIIHKVDCRSELFLGSLNDYTFAIKHKGNMQVDI